MNVSKNYFILLLLCIGAGIFSCKKEGLSHKSDFEKSSGEWEKFKKASGNTYQYTVFSNSWVGDSYQTVITVRNGKVVQRDFLWRGPADRNPVIPEDQKQWTEKENEINTHQYFGAEALTLEEIYATAKDYWLVKRENSETFFEAKNNGLLSRCGFVEDRCADDCFNGINITEIKKVE